MNNNSCQKPLELFATCPQSTSVQADSYLQRIADVARWSEHYGCKGILVYTDNSLVDAWLVSQIIIENTEKLCPLVAVQPVYMHPYSIAKLVSSFGYLYGRRIYLNMVAGGFKNDLATFNDTTSHDKRYTRLIEYTTIIKELLASPAPLTFEGEFHKVDKLKMTPSLSAELFPGIFISGSSDAGLAAAKILKATAVKYPKPAKECEAEALVDGIDSGVRLGIIARRDEVEAWEIAEQRFPEDRKGQITHQLAMKVSDSFWHQQLSQTAKHTKTERSPYWLRPFENYKTFCPYLVGSYDQVAAELARYIDLGYMTYILDVPPSQEELHHVKIAFDRASQMQTEKGANASK
jgi:alkanesulfonate monooxygenase